MNDWRLAEYETSVVYDSSEETISHYRNLLRENYPYIDEATPQEVIELIVDIIS